MTRRIPSWGDQPVIISNANVQFPFRIVGFFMICTFFMINPVKLLTTNMNTLAESKSNNDKIL